MNLGIQIIYVIPIFVKELNFNQNKKAMRKNQVEIWAPYSYLTYNDDISLYELFLLIPVGANNIVSLQGGENYNHADGVTKMEIKIVHQQNEEGTIPEILKYVSFRLRMPFKYKALPLNNGDKIMVKTKINDENGTRLDEKEIMILYKDKDAGYTGSDTSTVAHNCPYIYLDNTKTNQSVFTPFSIIPLLGYNLVDQLVQISSAENGLCESHVVLKKATRTFQKIEGDLEVNGEEVIFYDTNKVEGNLTTFVYHLDDDEKVGLFSHERSERSFSEILREINTIRTSTTTRFVQKKKKGKVRSGYAFYLEPLSDRYTATNNNRTDLPQQGDRV